MTKQATMQERISARPEALAYVNNLTGLAQTYGLQIVRAMTEDISSWPERPKGLGLSRSRRIMEDIGDILGWWR